MTSKRPDKAQEPLSSKMESPNKAGRIKLDQNIACGSQGDIRKEMEEGTRIRTGEKRRKLEEDYSRELAQLSAVIDERVRQDERELRQLRTAQLVRLRQLIERKVEIERAIVKHTQSLKETYDDCVGALEEVVRGRGEDLQECTPMANELRMMAGASRDEGVESETPRQKRGQKVIDDHLEDQGGHHIIHRSDQSPTNPDIHDINEGNLEAQVDTVRKTMLDNAKEVYLRQARQAARRRRSTTGTPTSTSPGNA